MSKERSISIVIPARNERESFERGFLQEVLENVPLEYDPTLVVAVNNSTSEFAQFVDKLAERDRRIRPWQLGNLAPRSFAYAYLFGLEYAVEKGADLVVEMDASGAHDPKDISRFLVKLEEGAEAALSSRFSPGGDIAGYPFQRRVISKVGTIWANLVLGLGEYVPDMTSGYEAFRREVLKDIFGLVPPEKWISVIRGPGHFYQTEMRAMICWRGNVIEMVPIVWGSERAKEPGNLPLKTVFRAFVSSVALRQRREKIKSGRGII